MPVFLGMQVNADGLPVFQAKQRAMHKRIAVAAEAISKSADIPIPHVPKSESVTRLIGKKDEGLRRICITFL